MTRTDPTAPFSDLNIALAQITADFGKWRVLSAMLRQLFLRKQPVAMLSPPILNEHLRKDMGLPPLSDRPLILHRWML